jgi:hypothetical protein
MSLTLVLVTNEEHEEENLPSIQRKSGGLSQQGREVSFKIMNEIMKMTKAEPEWKHNTEEAHEIFSI